MSGRDFAESLDWGQPKVSKIENGTQTASDSDVLAWLDAAGAPESLVEQMLSELRELRIEQVAWRRQLRAGHRERQQDFESLEAAASVIRNVDVAAVPGLLQTADYARHILASQAELFDVPAGEDIDATVRIRMQRQQILYEPGRTIEIIVSESAMYLPVCPASVMAAQVDRLVSAVGLPGVRVGVLPLYRRLPHVVWHGFWILDDQVLVENISAEHRVKDPDQVEIYRRLTDRLWDVAAQGDEARAILTAASAKWAQRAADAHDAQGRQP